MQTYLVESAVCISVLLHIIMFVSFNLSQGGIVAPDCELIVLSTEGILNAQEVLLPLLRILIYTMLPL